MSESSCTLENLTGGVGMVRVMIAVAALLAVACASDVTAPTVDPLAGRWVLQAVDGSDLPFALVESADGKFELMREVFAFANGAFVDTTVYRTTHLGAQESRTYPDSGTYTVTGSSVSIRWRNGNATTASLSDSTLTRSFFLGQTLLYRR